MPPKELWEAYSNRTVPMSVRPSHFVFGAYLYILWGRNPQFGVWLIVLLKEFVEKVIKNTQHAELIWISL